MKKKIKPKFKEMKASEVSAWINQLTINDYSKIRTEIIEKCYISRQTFSLWKNGANNPSPLAMEKINQIAEKYATTKENNDE